MLSLVEKLRCSVERVTYQNSENSFSVLRCRAQGYPELVTVTGNFPETCPGTVYCLEGFWKNDAKYGRQFTAVKAEETLPATAYGMEKYLGSGLVKGVGPKTARSIVAKFGADTFDIIEQSPERLLEVEGIGRVRQERIRKSWEEQKKVRALMVFLQEHDVSTAHAARIYKTYGDEALDVVREDPYRLAEEVWGIGFKTADSIAEKLGIAPDSPKRLRSGILFSLSKMSDEGHCFAVEAELVDKASEILSVEKEKLSPSLSSLIEERQVIRDGDALYLPPFYYAEKGTAERLIALMAEPMRKVDYAGLSYGLEYDEGQAEAVRLALSSKVMILTGGPGTGKTTTTKAIISSYQRAGLRVLLAAPTGRAAKRLSEASGLEAKTVHRLLEYKPPEGAGRNEEKPLEGDVLLIDECSMLDLLLFYSLLKAVPSGMSLILVGDSDQLPSVGAGNVLSDLIASGVIPVARLSKVFRQAAGSRIVMNAHRINKGQRLDLRGGSGSDFFFLETEKEKIADTVRDLCLQRLPSYYQLDSSQIQVLTPMQKGDAGAQNLNRLLQEALNHSELFLSRGGVQYRQGDKVMQIRNNYDKEVFNGDIGRIESVDTYERILAVSFDGRLVSYEQSELDELTLAYAVTVHKAQGSEYPAVVMPLTMGHYMLLQRKLLYTGVTRAKRLLVLVGEKRALYLALFKEDTSKRNTKLNERLRDADRIKKHGN